VSQTIEVSIRDGGLWYFHHTHHNGKQYKPSVFPFWITNVSTELDLIAQQWKWSLETLMEITFGGFLPPSPPSGYLLPNDLSSVYNTVENMAFYSRFDAQIAKLRFVLYKTNFKRHPGSR